MAHPADDEPTVRRGRRNIAAMLIKRARSRIIENQIGAADEEFGGGAQQRSMLIKRAKSGIFEDQEHAQTTNQRFGGVSVTSLTSDVDQASRSPR